MQQTIKVKAKTELSQDIFFLALWKAITESLEDKDFLPPQQETNP